MVGVDIVGDVGDNRIAVVGLAGADARVGSVEKGKIANLVITDGDLFEDGTQIKHVFVDGRMLVLEPAAPQRSGGRGRGGV